MVKLTFYEWFYKAFPTHPGSPLLGLHVSSSSSSFGLLFVPAPLSGGSGFFVPSSPPALGPLGSSLSGAAWSPRSPPTVDLLSAHCSGSSERPRALDTRGMSKKGAEGRNWGGDLSRVSFLERAHGGASARMGARAHSERICAHGGASARMGVHLRAC